MQKYGEVKLIPRIHAQDALGQPIDAAIDSRLIQCEIGSITRTEWLTAAQGGFSAEIMLIVFSDSYNGEKSAIFNGHEYTIYRTYVDGDRTELYLASRVGDS